MSDLMGPAGGSQGAAALDNFKKNRSMLNPMDLADMTQDGSLRPDMTIAEFFQSTMGLDVNTNTIMDMVKATKQNVANGNPLEKMKNLSKGSAPGMGQAAPPSPQMQQGPPPGPPKGLADLATL